MPQLSDKIEGTQSSLQLKVKYNTRQTALSLNHNQLQIDSIVKYINIPTNTYLINHIIIVYL